MTRLTNVQLSSSGRIISDTSGFDEKTNRGIRTHNRLGKFFADWFGSGTFKVYIDDKKYYLNKNSCYTLIGEKGFDCPIKDKFHVVGQIQSIFNQMHAEEEVRSRSAGPMVQIMQWVEGNWITDAVYQEAVATIKFFQYINTAAGRHEILSKFAPPTDFDGLYKFKCQLLNGIVFHYRSTVKASDEALNSLLAQFINSINLLKTDKQKIQFFQELDGLCIEAKTSKAFLYAASLASTPDVELEPFYTLAQKYCDEAHKALEGQTITLDSLAEHIVAHHGGEKCLPDPYCCPDGVINNESARKFLEVTGF